MLRDIKQFYGVKLRATDGEIGHVKDFYFDDKTWAVRYVVAETGSWLVGRQVLLPPHVFDETALKNFDPGLGLLRVQLTKKQIEGSPSIESHRPVSRQYEKDYYAYYNWPAYWQEPEMVLDAVGFSAASARSGSESSSHHGHNQRDDLHLHSTKAVTGYHVETIDGKIGTVSSFMMHGHSWGIRELVVASGNWYAGKTVLFLRENVTKISFKDSTVFVNVTKDAIRQTAENGVVNGILS